MKYQVGDIVRVRNDVKEESYHNLIFFNPDMSIWKGRDMEIRECHCRIDGITTYKLKDIKKDEVLHWVWVESWLEPAYDEFDDMDYSNLTLDAIL